MPRNASRVRRRDPRTDCVLYVITTHKERRKTVNAARIAQKCAPKQNKGINYTGAGPAAVAGAYGTSSESAGSDDVVVVDGVATGVCIISVCGGCSGACCSREAAADAGAFVTSVAYADTGVAAAAHTYARVLPVAVVAGDAAGGHAVAAATTAAADDAAVAAESDRNAAEGTPYTGCCRAGLAHASTDA